MKRKKSSRGSRVAKRPKATPVEQLERCEQSKQASLMGLPKELRLQVLSYLLPNVTNIPNRSDEQRKRRFIWNQEQEDGFLLKKVDPFDSILDCLFLKMYWLYGTSSDSPCSDTYDIVCTALVHGDVIHRQPGSSHNLESPTFVSMVSRVKLCISCASPTASMDFI
ncbi:hypothetical protein EJ08DRAFT_387869 [Tothia fuscella]|uniref:Uncharacterized protein n=1 Tax=Tothia fuscella TaxID=1048955 RepID=A0A9P4U3K7_9PEZI|nr:hypothetical protein EJ08DRAFT_387869 [Tothia fuscella]